MHDVTNAQGCKLTIRVWVSSNTSAIAACSDEAHDPLPMQLLQKYIAYARQYCHPVLSDDAKQVLKEYYCKLRQDSLTMEGTPVTVSSFVMMTCACRDMKL